MSKISKIKLQNDEAARDLVDSSAIHYTEAQTLTAEQKTIAKQNISLENVDNTSDATKKTNFTGSIASGNTGFATGGDIYDELQIEMTAAELEIIWNGVT